MQKAIGCYIDGGCKEVDRNDVEDAKWVFFWSRKVPIEEGAIDKDVEIIGFTGSTAETYAHAHGNRFSVIDDLTYDLTKLPNGITIEDDTIAAKGQVYLRLTGLQNTQLAETVPGTHLELGRLNQCVLRVVFSHIAYLDSIRTLLWENGKCKESSKKIIRSLNDGIGNYLNLLGNNLKKFNADVSKDNIIFERINNVYKYVDENTSDSDPYINSISSNEVPVVV